jgi:hypothetical protein
MDMKRNILLIKKKMNRNLSILLLSFLLFIFVTIGFLFPIHINVSLPLAWILVFIAIGFLHGIIAGLLLEYNSFYSKRIINAVWDIHLNPFIKITYGQFISFCIIAFGFGSVIKDFIINTTLNLVGLVLISIGIGALLGLFLSKKNRGIA